MPSMLARHTLQLIGYRQDGPLYDRKCFADEYVPLFGTGKIMISFVNDNVLHKRGKVLNIWLDRMNRSAAGGNDANR